MNMELNTLLKNFQSVIISYQDVSAIYAKLISQGQIQKLAAVLNEIYDEEHVFTLTELQRYCKDNNQKEDEFVAEQYELNSNIFRRNLTLIVQNLVEEVGKKYLEKFRQDISNRSPVETEPQYEENQDAEHSVEKSQYKSNMPEIQEETEHSGIAGTNSSTFRPRGPDTEGDELTPSNRFDLNINELNAKVQAQPQQGQVINNIQKQQPKNNSNNNNQQNTNFEDDQKVSNKVVEALVKKAYAVTEPVDEEDQFERVTPFSRFEESNSGLSENNRYDQFGQYDSSDSSNYRANLQKYYKNAAQTQNKYNQFTNSTQFSNNNSTQYWSSPDRSKALAHKNMHNNNNSSNLRRNKAASPERIEGNISQSFTNRSTSRWNTSNDRPDPSILDSEFSYSQGRSFAKSPKKFHYDIQDVPGPGNYELEDGQKLVRPVTPDVCFPKSPKVPSYFKKSNVPGAIYYPIRHFLSK